MFSKGIHLGLAGLIPGLFFVQLLCAQTAPCPDHPVLPENLRATSLSYLKLSNDPADHRYRIFYTLTGPCGLLATKNPLIVENPQHENVGALLPLVADSVRNIIGPPDPCVNFPTPPCLSVYYYHADTVLPDDLFGYVASIFDCCRPGYTNVPNDSSGDFYIPSPPLSGSVSPCTPGCGIGTVYNGISSAIRIPPFADYPVNSSPQFVRQDTVLFLCKDSAFSSSVAAVDPDGDSIAYHFARPTSFVLSWNCYTGGYNMVTSPVFPLLDYGNAPYTNDEPAGPGVTIDAHTGMVRGVFDDTGTFLIVVSACEYRKGVLLDSTTRDLMIRVYDCSFLTVGAKAGFPAAGSQCTGYTAAFTNTTAPDNNNYNIVRRFLWNFGDGDTSTAVNPVHTYTDTGLYNVQLVVFPGLWCADTAFGKMAVYPYVYPHFSSFDSCSDQPILFTNTSVATDSSGEIIASRWQVVQGDMVIANDQGTDLTYSFMKAPYSYGVILTVTTDKGCITSDTQYVDIYRSPLPLAFSDTLLAVGQPLSLQANDGDNNNNADGSFTWSPAAGLNDPNIADPVLTGTTEATYYVKITNMWGCSLVDSFSVKYYAGPAIYVPSAFTPNGDGRNDVFRPLAVGAEGSFQFRVFNRNGVLLFESERNGPGWDGTMHGRPAPTGTYVWEGVAIDYLGRRMVRRGTVELIR